jgi:hypothetical protein
MRKYDSLIYLKGMGLNVGVLKEFDYSQRKELYAYARYLIKKFGGLIVRTDFPKYITDKKPIGLPYISDCKDFRKLEAFVESHKGKYTYILLQMIGNEKTILSAYVYLDESKRLCGEINDVDKLDMPRNMNVTEHLKQICIGPDGDDEMLEAIRADLIKARVPPNRIVELVIFNINGKPTPFYKQLRGEGF